MATAIEYTVTLGLTGLILVILVSGMANVVGVQEDRTTAEQLNVVGQGMAADLDAADRLLTDIDARDGRVSTTYREHRSYPSTIVTTGYRVNVTNETLILETTDRSTSAIVHHNVPATHIRETEFRGGDIEIVWDDDHDEIVLRPRGGG